MSNWDALSIQVAWFASDARRVDISALYNELFATSPDAIQNNKVPTPAAPFLSAASGQFGDLAVQLHVQSARIDLFVQPPPPTDPPDAPSSITDLEELVSNLTLYGEVVGAHLNSVNRLALVTTLFNLADSLPAANRGAAEAAGVALPGYEISDFSFQLNSRRAAPSQPQVQLNRLLKFGVLTFQTVLMDVALYGIAPTNRQSFASSLQIDVNTIPQLQPIPLDAQISAWSDLVAEMLALRENGTLKGLWR